jgi:uncharacterized protein YaiE (UPF0345 family)
MVIQTNNKSGRERGSLMAEMLVAIAILVGVMLPVAYSYEAENRLARAYYCRAVAMEIVDGEMEVLLAGEWRAFTPGTHPYEVKAESRTNLPAGQFTVTVQTNKVRLEWQPAVTRYGGPVAREALLK